jgi:hypothetical protein
MDKVRKNAQPSVFNSPFELGLRMVYLLSAIKPNGADLQKLVLLDYAIVYSGDLKGPQSLHTPVPYRGTELLSRRELIEQGLYLMSTRGLVGATIDETGVTYFAGPAAFTLVGSLTSAYFLALEARCNWAASEFSYKKSITLVAEFSDMGHLWGAELEAGMTRGRQWQLL